MSSATIVGLGAIAGFTIFLGLPFGRVRGASARIRAALNAMATGILLFLLWDVLSHAIEPVEESLVAASTGQGLWRAFAGRALLLAAGLTVGLVSLVYYDQWMGRRAAAATARRFGPGAMSMAEHRRGADPVLAADGFDFPTPGSGAISLADVTLHPVLRLSLLISVGIGLHNFAEGLAIGQSAASGELNLALLLVIGFGLHNGTEGFGIVAPLATYGARPTWATLGMLGLIAGGPTFVGTVVGRSFVNDVVYRGSLALAAGSILYVVMQLLKVAFRLGHPRTLAWGLLGGILLGLATDFVVTAAQA
jgi:ZIP family zinc transporter